MTNAEHPARDTDSQHSVTASRTVTLPTNQHGPITATTDTDWLTGAVRYHVRGARVEGVFVVLPRFASDRVDLDTDLLRITFGEPPPGAGLEEYYCGPGSGYRNKPTVNGVPLEGAITCPAGNVVAGRTSRDELGLYLRRAGGGGLSFNATMRVRAVIIALVTHWTAHPDRTQVMRAAARLAARSTSRRTANAAAIDRLSQQITELTAQRRARENDAHLMRELADQPPTSPEPCTECGASPHEPCAPYCLAPVHAEDAATP